MGIEARGITRGECAICCDNGGMAPPGCRGCIRSRYAGALAHGVEVRLPHIGTRLSGLACDRSSCQHFAHCCFGHTATTNWRGKIQSQKEFLTTSGNMFFENFTSTPKIVSALLVESPTSRDSNRCPPKDPASQRPRLDLRGAEGQCQVPNSGALTADSALSVAYLTFTWGDVFEIDRSSITTYYCHMFGVFVEGNLKMIRSTFEC